MVMQNEAFEHNKIYDDYVHKLTTNIPLNKYKRFNLLCRASHSPMGVKVREGIDYMIEHPELFFRELHHEPLEDWRIHKQELKASQPDYEIRDPKKFKTFHWFQKQKENS